MTQIYSLIDLGPGQATSINNHNVVVGTDGTNAVEWIGSKATILGPGTANSINDAGAVVGTSNGNAVEYGSLNLGPGSAMSINSAGVIAGDLLENANKVGNPAYYNDAFYYDGSTHLLGNFGEAGAGSYAYAISNNGYATGMAATPNWFQAFGYAQGSPAIASLHVVGTGMGINNGGMIVGTCAPNNQTGIAANHAFLLMNGERDLGVGSLAGINNHNVAVGSFMYDANSGTSTSWSQLGFNGFQAAAINDNGWIAGTLGSDAVVLRPGLNVPEPSGLWIAGIAMLWFVWLGWRRK